MTSAARTNNRHPRGFTLLEIVIVMAIAAVVMGGAVTLLVFSSSEHTLRNASGEVEMLAKQARTTAILHQTPYALEFRQGIVRLLPLAEAGQDEKRTAGGHEIGGEEVVSDAGVRRQFVFPGDMGVFIRRWDSNDWLPTGKNSIHIWRFDPSGLCEPLGVRLTLGGSWIEDTFNPLTAAIRDTQYEMK